MNSRLLPHLETFLAAAELGSFTAAARALGLTQAAVSQRIQALERELRTALFRRDGGRALLTDAGKRLTPIAQQILELHDEARSQVTGQRAAVSAELALAASSVPGEHLLPALLAVFRRQQPRVQVRMTVSDSQAVLTLVEQGKAHLGFIGRPCPSPHLESQVFARDELVVVAPPKHPWARRRRITLDQLRRQPLILREAGSGSRWQLEQALLRAGLPIAQLRVVMELGSNEAVKETILRGLGVAILSIHAVHKEHQSGQLRTLTIQDLPLDRELFVVWDRRRALPLAARLFLEFLEVTPSATSKP